MKVQKIKVDPQSTLLLYSSIHTFRSQW